ncbi:hypothetical protein Hanom_Chr10g00966841 [Helianthus anomalus]
MCNILYILIGNKNNNIIQQLSLLNFISVKAFSWINLPIIGPGVSLEAVYLFLRGRGKVVYILPSLDPILALLLVRFTKYDDDDAIFMFAIRFPSWRIWALLRIRDTSVLVRLRPAWDTGSSQVAVIW